MNTKTLTFLFVLCSFSLFAANMPFYVLSAETFATDFGNIDQDHLSAFQWNTGGVGIEAVESYLENVVFEGEYDSIYLEAPAMCLPTKDKDSLQVRATGEFENYHFSFYRAQDGYYETTTSSSANFSVLMEHDIFFNLLTIYGSTGDSRSKVYFIIIEKDFFTCDSTHYQYQNGRDKKNFRIKQDQKEMEVKSFPNPTTGPSQLSFHLEEAQKVSLDILNPITGEIIASQLDNQYLLPGDHQFNFNLQSLPPGMYLLVLRTEHRRLSDLIVKAN